jgi:hypothetical protein
LVRTLKIAVLSGLCLVGALSSGTARANEAGSEASAVVRQVAMVRLQIRVGDHVLRAPIRAVSWGETATFVVEGAGGRHVVRLRPEAESGRASVRLSYERDGATVASDTRRDVELRRTTRVFADEGVSIAVAIIPTRVSITAE